MLGFTYKIFCFGFYKEFFLYKNYIDKIQKGLINR